MTCLKGTKKEIVSYKMSRVRAKGTGIEKIMGSAFWASGLRGYRKNLKGILGTPDFCWKRQKLAVFCDSSFWHGYNWKEQKNTIKVRKKFWFNKIETNIARDKEVNRKLRNDGWKVLRFWDFQIKRDPQRCAKKIALALQELL